MQFITNGPDIPDALLQAHEEGNVVFFCGAGISYPAGLPGFGGLVKDIYKLNGTTPSDFEREAIERAQFDAALDLLERRLPGQRLAVRSALAEALKPKLRRKGAIDTHAALLKLSRNREGTRRLVTTNFDRIFHTAARRTNQAFESYAAPLLPIPKNSRWDGLVYLHGLLPKDIDDTSLNRLVVTSGDFGLAYLTERWAARFVSELFRNYVVCFVGYSINDPVLRYMMDALAADRMLGEVTPQAWALGDYIPGQEAHKTNEWEAKGVKPILYEVPAESNDHSKLHLTLHSWAETYQDGTLGKERIIVSHALAQPSASTQQDDFVGRMLWALSDKSGLPAKRFSNLNPVPSLDWLFEALAEERFRGTDLNRFNLTATEIPNKDLRFSLISRPAPYQLAPYMQLASSSNMLSQFDDIMYHLAHWLTRHLNDPELIIWIAQSGGQLNENWTLLIKSELERLDSLERDGKASELRDIQRQAPNAIPSPLMRSLWNLLLSNRVKSTLNNSDLYRWKKKMKREGITTFVRLELRELLAPKITLKKPFRWNDKDESLDEPTSLRQLVDWDLELESDHVYSALEDRGQEYWKCALPLLLEDFQQLLHDALGLLKELGDADTHSDRSHWALPSITPHWQNRGYHDWGILIELLRDAWLEIQAKDNTKAAKIAHSWFEQPFPTFKRLALFAASQTDCISPESWVDWLRSDGTWWLWSTDTGREVFRLLSLQGSTLAENTQQQLETAILAGPPREMYREDLEDNRWLEIVERSVWLHLAKLKSSGLILSPDAETRLESLSQANPNWQLSPNEREEFSHWMSGSGDPDYEENRKIDIAPRTRLELVNWLSTPPSEDQLFYEDTWRDVCRTRFFHSIFALNDLACDNKWPVDRWREALQEWSGDDLILRSWKYGAELVYSMPTNVLQEIAYSVTNWIKSISKSINQHEETFLLLCRRILDLPEDTDTRTTLEDTLSYQPVAEAINHPVGHAIQALINIWFSRKPNDNEGLPTDIKPFFTDVCNTQIERYRHGRVLLSSRLITLFRVDRAWTEEFLLPLYNWSNPVEAKALWEGFLWSPRLHQPLLTTIKPNFLETANHYDELGEHRQQFATFLTYAALGPIEDYDIDELRSAIEALPQEGLEHAAQGLRQALEGSGKQRENYWANRVQPFWQNYWPKSINLATPRISESLIHLVIAARSEFPSALRLMGEWLQPIEHPHYSVHRLHESGLCSKFPEDSLQLLNLIIQDQQWGPRELDKCLDAIEQESPQLTRDGRYLRLREYHQRRGII